MKIKIKKRALETALHVATIAVASGEDSKLESHYLFRHEVATNKTYILSQDKRRLLAQVPITDVEVSNIADNVEYDAFTVPGWRLRQWLTATESGDADLTLTSNGGVTKATSKRGSGTWGSLNPKDFPYWDSTFTAAKVITKISAQHLSHILSYLKNFVSDQDRNPSLLAAEAKDGVFFATNSILVGRVAVQALAKSAMRIHGKDIPSVLSFLGLIGDAEVEVREHERCLYLVRDDGAVLGVSRWVDEFPTIAGLPVDPTTPLKSYFTVNTAELLAAIKFLSVFAKKEDVRLRFKVVDPDPATTSQGVLQISMQSGSGSGTEDIQEVPCIASGGMQDIRDAGHEDFILSKGYVETIANAFGDDTITFRVELAKRHGYVYFHNERDTDNYFSLLTWSKK